MTPPAHTETVQTLNIHKEIQIAAPLETTFSAMLEGISSGNAMPDGTPYPFKLEAWPGGRWFRDLGNNAGHLWGHVQVIKPPTLLEISGPLMMSYPACNFVQYRLAAEGTGTRLTLVHRGMGLITPEHREGLTKGWDHWLQVTERFALQRAKTKPRAAAMAR
ncbi:hypothetical protein BH11PLA1_BH11PLA1_09130 [soil metagenome]